MALTTTQKAQIRQYLGYPDLWRYKHTRLEGVLDGQLDADAEALIVTALANIATVEAKILSSTLNTSGIRKVDEIEFFKNSASIEVMKLGRMYVGRISITLGIPIYSDIFGTQGYLGDQYSAGGLGQPINGGRGGMFPLG